MLFAGLVVLLTLAGLASSARATAANGVHFDPDSPAGKEYALPLNQARDEATGGGSDEDSAASAPLFGAGVTPPGPASTPAPGSEGDDSRRAAGDDSGQPATGGTGQAAARRGSTPSAAAVVRIADSTEGYPLSSGAALVAAIMLLGGVLGLALRGLQRHSAPL